VRACIASYAGFLVALGCSDPAPLPPAPTAPRSTLLVDPDALAEGPLEAFGLRFPEGSAIKRETPSTMSVEVPAPLEKTLDYLRERTLGTERTEGSRVFVDAGTVRASSARVRIVVRATSTSTEVTIKKLFEATGSSEPLSAELVPETSASAPPPGQHGGLPPLPPDLAGRQRR
jgi:hypothetical protein